MARIRTIKPEFWQDEKLAKLPALTRLVFLGLISLADDAGRMIDNAKMLDGQLFPETDDTCRDALAELHALGRIVRYESGSGQRLLQLTNWDAHQKVKNPSLYVLPAPPVHGEVMGDPPPPAGPTESRGRAGGESTEDLTPRSPIPDPRSGIPDHNYATPDGVGAASGADPAVAVVAADETPGVGHHTPAGTAVAVVGHGVLPADDYELLDDDAGGADPPDVIPLRRSRTVEEAVRLLVPVGSSRLSGAQVLRAWLSMQPRQLSREEREQFGGVAKSLADRHTPAEIAAAFIGIGELAPHCAPFNEPWDLLQLKKKFSRAAAAALNHRAIKQQRVNDAFDQILDERQEATG